MKPKFIMILLSVFLFISSCKEKTSSIEKKQESGIDNQDTNQSTMTSPEDEDASDPKEMKVTKKIEEDQVKEFPKKNTDNKESIQVENQEDARPAPKPEKIESLDPVRLEEVKKNPKPEPEKPVIKKANPTIYQQLLSKYVNAAGMVRYSDLKREVAQLEAYTEALSDDPTFTSGTRDEKLALWINAYNAYTLLMIAKHFPIHSIRKLYEGKPWDVEWIRIGKKTYSLNQIENDIIRPQFNEPRIHFVLNCGALSCPPLQNEVLTAQNLERILEKSTKDFINGKSNLLQENVIYISSIFDWYRTDFGDVLAFIKKYANQGINPDVKIKYLPYDWTLNKQ